MGFDDFLRSVQAPQLREIALHWQAARGPKRMPAWSDIDPAAIARHLPIVWSWKYDRATDEFTGRLAGEVINGLYGKPMRGARMSEFFAPSHYRRIFANHRRIVVEPALGHAIGAVYVHTERNGYGERVLLPLAANGQTGDGLFGASLYSFDRPLAIANRLNPEPEPTKFFPLDL